LKTRSAIPRQQNNYQRLQPSHLDLECFICCESRNGRGFRGVHK